ncbi:MAG: NAD-dependent epimerase/dehydratase family protein, partial [Bacilli bacterium]|nr:NAD-dependent epimerase/dehydratase family protein [Bacilli bacterium]
MKILVTGSEGMVGTALIRRLKAIRDGLDKTRLNLHVSEIYECDVLTPAYELRDYCRQCDFVFHLAAIHRPDNPVDLFEVNCGFTAHVLDTLEELGNPCPVMFSSSIQAVKGRRYGDSPYGQSKREAEARFFKYEADNGVPTFVYRFPNLLGHSSPYHNSAVSTFCYAIANGLDYHVDDEHKVIEFLYIDDLIDGMLDMLSGKAKRCDYKGSRPTPNPEGKFCYIPKTHKVTLGKIVNLLEEFNKYPSTLSMPK